MNEEELRAKFGAALNAPPAPPLEATKKFLSLYCDDADGMEEINQHIKRMSKVNTRTLEQGLAGIEGLLANPPDDDVLIQLVAVDTGWVLDEVTGDAAKVWLGELAQMLREALGK
jgi:hypothetical protein